MNLAILSHTMKEHDEVDSYKLTTGQLWWALDSKCFFLLLLHENRTRGSPVVSWKTLKYSNLLGQKGLKPVNILKKSYLSIKWEQECEI